MFNTLENNRLSFFIVVLCLSGFGPVFLILGIKGLDYCTFKNASRYAFTIVMTLLAIIPTGVLILTRALRSSQRVASVRWSISSSERVDEHVYAYLLTLIFPLMTPTISSERELFATLVMLVIAISVYYRANLYYANVWALILGKSVHILQLTTNDGKRSADRRIILITSLNAKVPNSIGTLSLQPLAGPIYFLEEQ